MDWGLQMNAISPPAATCTAMARLPHQSISQRTTRSPGATSSRIVSPELIDAAGIWSTTTTYERLRSPRKPSGRRISRSPVGPVARDGAIDCRYSTVPACRCMTNGTSRETAKPISSTTQAHVSHSHPPVAIAAPAMSSERIVAAHRKAGPRTVERLSTRPACTRTAAPRHRRLQVSVRGDASTDRKASGYGVAVRRQHV